MMTPQLFSVAGVAGISVDAYLPDRVGNLLFLSGWGRDVSVQELLARLTLPDSTDGLRHIELYSRGQSVVSMGTPPARCLDKLTGRAPKGGLIAGYTQFFIHDVGVRQIDHQRFVAKTIWLEDFDSDRAWPLVKAVSPYPLLDHWQEAVLTHLVDTGQLVPLSGHRVSGCNIQLDDTHFGAFLSEQVRNAHFTVSTVAAKKAA